MSELEILEIWGLEFGSPDDSYTFIQEQHGVNIYKLIGCFLVGGEEEVDGWLYLSEDHLNTMLARQPIAFGYIESNTAYTVKKSTYSEIGRLNELRYEVEFVGGIKDEVGAHYRLYGLKSISEIIEKEAR
jgi:hypothetical protein